MLDSRFISRPIAHRGLHDLAQGRPENSIEAIDAAIAHGYAIEIDVQISSDGVAMVFHDYSLERLTSQKGAIHQVTAAALSCIILKGGAHEIPTLTDVLKLVAGRVPLLIEIKDQDGQMGPNVGPLEQAVAHAIRGYQGDIAVMSFNPHAIKAFGDLAPDVARGLVTSAYRPKEWPDLPVKTCETLRNIPDYEHVGACFISHEANDVTRTRVRELKEQGAHILCWTIRDEQTDKQARNVVHNVTFEGYLPPLCAPD